MTTAYVALGSNLGDREAHLRAALAALAALPETRVACVSAFRETEPIAAEPPRFLNAVCALSTALAPDALLAALHEIEAALGRTRPRPGAPRTIDLDLLLHGETVATGERLALPHPRMRWRRFVLEPLVEIAPDARDPLTGERYADLLAALAPRR